MSASIHVMKDPKKKQKNRIESIFLFKLTRRFSLFLALQQIVLLTLYVSGNVQNFLDSTQLIILALCAVVSVALIVFSLAGIIQSVGFFIASFKKRYIMTFFVYILTLAFSIFLFVALRLISFLASGLGAL